jgi:hypothetical protein
MKLYWVLPVCAVAIACGGGGSGSGTGITATTGSTTGSPGVPGLGPMASMNDKQIFPSSDAWNTPIDTAPVDPNSANLIASIGLTTGLHPDFGANYDGGPFGIPYTVVTGTQAKVKVSFMYSDQSDPGPYAIPSNAPIEGGSNSTGDRHVIVVDRDHWILYELWDAYPLSNGSWTAGSGAIFNLTTDTVRPAGWTSADAAGLPILPGLVRYDEVHAGAINHALRFTVQNTRQGYVAPARHYASSNTSPDVPPMGMRVRLKASFDISGFPSDAQVILKALKKYGMMVADNGSNWFISGTPDPRWNDNDMNTLKTVQGSNFEVVKMGPITTN